MKNNLFEKLWLPFRRALADVPWFGPTFSTVLIASLINVLTSSLSEWGGSALSWGFVFLLGLLTIAFVLTYNRRYNRWRRNLGPIADISQPRKYEGLIMLFTREETLREALGHHIPVLKYCWLIVTPETQNDAGSVISKFTDIQFSILPVAHLYDTQACYEVVKHIYQSGARDRGLLPENVIADITGGTKPMTMGMIVACIEGGFPIEHVPARFDSLNKPIGTLPPIEIRIQHN
jgi:hypothetical protein